MPPRHVKVKLEVGHRSKQFAEPGGNNPEKHTHRWTVFVESGISGVPIEHFVERIQFTLHESFERPIRVISTPPFAVCETGYAGFIIQMVVLLKYSKKELKFNYDMNLKYVASDEQKSTLSFEVADVSHELAAVLSRGKIAENSVTDHNSVISKTTKTKIMPAPSKPIDNNNTFNDLFGQAIQIGPKAAKPLPSVSGGKPVSSVLQANSHTAVTSSQPHFDVNLYKHLVEAVGGDANSPIPTVVSPATKMDVDDLFSPDSPDAFESRETGEFSNGRKPRVAHLDVKSGSTTLKAKIDSDRHKDTAKVKAKKKTKKSAPTLKAVSPLAASSVGQNGRSSTVLTTASSHGSKTDNKKTDIQTISSQQQKQKSPATNAGTGIMASSSECLTPAVKTAGSANSGAVQPKHARKESSDSSDSSHNNQPKAKKRAAQRGTATSLTATTKAPVVGAAQKPSTAQKRTRLADSSDSSDDSSEEENEQNRRPVAKKAAVASSQTSLQAKVAQPAKKPQQSSSSSDDDSDDEKIANTIHIREGRLEHFPNARELTKDPAARVSFNMLSALARQLNTTVAQLLVSDPSLAGKYARKAVREKFRQNGCKTTEDITSGVAGLLAILKTHEQGLNSKVVEFSKAGEGNAVDVLDGEGGIQDASVPDDPALAPPGTSTAPARFMPVNVVDQTQKQAQSSSANNSVSPATEHRQSPAAPAIKPLPEKKETAKAKLQPSTEASSVAAIPPVTPPSKQLEPSMAEPDAPSGGKKRKVQDKEATADKSTNAVVQSDVAAEQNEKVDVAAKPSGRGSRAKGHIGAAELTALSDGKASIASDTSADPTVEAKKRPRAVAEAKVKEVVEQVAVAPPAAKPKTRVARKPEVAVLGESEEAGQTEPAAKSVRARRAKAAEPIAEQAKDETLPDIVTAKTQKAAKSTTTAVAAKTVEAVELATGKALEAAAVMSDAVTNGSSNLQRHLSDTHVDTNHFNDIDERLSHADDTNDAATLLDDEFLDDYARTTDPVFLEPSIVEPYSAAGALLIAADHSGDKNASEDMAALLPDDSSTPSDPSPVADGSNEADHSDGYAPAHSSAPIVSERCVGDDGSHYLMEVHEEAQESSDDCADVNAADKHPVVEESHLSSINLCSEGTSDSHSDVIDEQSAHNAVVVSVSPRVSDLESESLISSSAADDKMADSKEPSSSIEDRSLADVEQCLDNMANIVSGGIASANDQPLAETANALAKAASTPEKPALKKASSSDDSSSAGDEQQTGAVKEVNSAAGISQTAKTSIEPISASSSTPSHSKQQPAKGDTSSDSSSEVEKEATKSAASIKTAPSMPTINLPSPEIPLQSTAKESSSSDFDALLSKQHPAALPQADVDESLNHTLAKQNPPKQSKDDESDSVSSSADENPTKSGASAARLNASAAGLTNGDIDGLSSAHSVEDKAKRRQSEPFKRVTLSKDDVESKFRDNSFQAKSSALLTFVIKGLYNWFEISDGEVKSAIEQFGEVVSIRRYKSYAFVEANEKVVAKVFAANFGAIRIKNTSFPLEFAHGNRNS